MGTQAAGVRGQGPAVCWDQPKARKSEAHCAACCEVLDKGLSFLICKLSVIVTTWINTVRIRSAVQRASSRTYGRQTVDTHSRGYDDWTDLGPGSLPTLWTLQITQHQSASCSRDFYY